MFAEAFNSINYIAVLICTLIYFFGGFLWYSPMLFGKTWVKLHKFEKDFSGGFSGKLFHSFFNIYIIVLFTAVLLQMLGMTGVTGGIKLGLFLSAGFMLTTNGINFTFEVKSYRVFLIDTGYHFVFITLVSAILSAWP